MNIKLFVCGDVMTGRGIDQILAHSSDPVIHELYIKDARDYVKLAENVNGVIPRKVQADYIWGDAFIEWKKQMPHFKIINLETAITQSENYWKYKGINYRMHPQNIDVLKSADIDVCVVANNHILDWGHEGLKETLNSLQSSNIMFAGAGQTLMQAMQPAIINVSDSNRILIFAVGMESCGISLDWAATKNRAGIFFIKDFSKKSVQWIKKAIEIHKKPNDFIVLSIHWGSNWGYQLPPSYQTFAHDLIDKAGIDFIYGHSSHHPRPIEIYKNKPILYGCGDFINDYEGILGYDEYRNDLSLMYFIEFNLPLKKLTRLEMIPITIKRFQIHYANSEDRRWLLDTLSRESAAFGTQMKENNANAIVVE